MAGWEEFPRTLLNLAVAFALGIPIGWERELGRTLGPGLRTYPLLALGACGYLEVSNYVFVDQPEAQARVFQGLVSGIGFIGAGAIIKGRAQIHGLAAAVSLWVTVCVGAAASYRLYALAAVLSLVMLVTLRLLKPLKPEEEDGEEADAPDAK